MLHLAILHGFHEIVEYLIFKENVEVWNASMDDDMNSLHLASWAGHLSIVKLLVEKVNKKYLDVPTINTKNTALHYACLANVVSVVKYLLQSGADISIKDNQGFNALILASSRNHFDVCRYILEDYLPSSEWKDSDFVNVTDNRGSTALDYAVDRKYHTLCQYLANRGGKAGLKAGEYVNSLMVNSEELLSSTTAKSPSKMDVYISSAEVDTLSPPPASVPGKEQLVGSDKLNCNIENITLGITSSTPNTPGVVAVGESEEVAQEVHVGATDNTLTAAEHALHLIKSNSGSPMKVNRLEVVDAKQGSPVPVAQNGLQDREHRVPPSDFPLNSTQSSLKNALLHFQNKLQKPTLPPPAVKPEAAKPSTASVQEKENIEYDNRLAPPPGSIRAFIPPNVAEIADNSLDAEPEPALEGNVVVQGELDQERKHLHEMNNTEAVIECWRQCTLAGHADVLETLVESHVYLQCNLYNMQDEQGYSLLMRACQGGFIDIVAYILDTYSTVYATSYSLSSSHQMYIKSGPLDLLSYVNAANIHDKRGNKHIHTDKLPYGGYSADDDQQQHSLPHTALFYACTNNHADIAVYMVQLCYEKGLDIVSCCYRSVGSAIVGTDKKVKGITTLLHVVANRCVHLLSIEDGSHQEEIRRSDAMTVDLMRFLINNTVLHDYVSQQDMINGNTALHYAVIRRNVPLVEYLLMETSIDTNIVNNKYLTAFHLSKTQEIKRKFIDSYQHRKSQKVQYEYHIASNRRGTLIGEHHHDMVNDVSAVEAPSYDVIREQERMKRTKQLEKLGQSLAEERAEVIERNRKLSFAGKMERSPSALGVQTNSPSASMSAESVSPTSSAKKRYSDSGVYGTTFASRYRMQHHDEFRAPLPDQAELTKKFSFAQVNQRASGSQKSPPKHSYINNGTASMNMKRRSPSKKPLNASRMFDQESFGADNTRSSWQPTALTPSELLQPFKLPGKHFNPNGEGVISSPCGKLTVDTGFFSEDGSYEKRHGMSSKNSVSRYSGYMSDGYDSGEYSTSSGNRGRGRVDSPGSLGSSISCSASGSGSRKLLRTSSYYAEKQRERRDMHKQSRYKEADDLKTRQYHSDDEFAALQTRNMRRALTRDYSFSGNGHPRHIVRKHSGSKGTPLPHSSRLLGDTFSSSIRKQIVMSTSKSARENKQRFAHKENYRNNAHSFAAASGPASTAPREQYFDSSQLIAHHKQHSQRNELCSPQVQSDQADGLDDDEDYGDEVYSYLSDEEFNSNSILGTGGGSSRRRSTVGRRGSSVPKQALPQTHSGKEGFVRESVNMKDIDPTFRMYDHDRGVYFDMRSFDGSKHRSMEELLTNQYKIAQPHVGRNRDGESDEEVQGVTVKMSRDEADGDPMTSILDILPEGESSRSNRNGVLLSVMCLYGLSSNVAKAFYRWKHNQPRSSVTANSRSGSRPSSANMMRRPITVSGSAYDEHNISEIAKVWGSEENGGNVHDPAGNSVVSVTSPESLDMTLDLSQNHSDPINPIENHQYGDPHSGGKRMLPASYRPAPVPLKQNSEPASSAPGIIAPVSRRKSINIPPARRKSTFFDYFDSNQVQVNSKKPAKHEGTTSPFESLQGREKLSALVKANEVSLWILFCHYCTHKDANKNDLEGTYRLRKQMLSLFGFYSLCRDFDIIQANRIKVLGNTNIPSTRTKISELVNQVVPSTSSMAEDKPLLSFNEFIQVQFLS